VQYRAASLLALLVLAGLSTARMIAAAPASPASPASTAPGAGRNARTAPLAAAAPAPVFWNSTSALAMAEIGARWAPPDLERNILRRYGSFRAGVREGLETARQPNSAIESLAASHAKRAREDLRNLRPFAEFVRDLGRLAGVLVAANQPLAARAAPAGPSASDIRQPLYRDDFLRYFESARPRYALARYNRGPATPDRLAAAARKRSATLYPAIAREYRRAGAAYSAGFDDRSVAFAVAALSHNHAASDVAAALRWVWLQSGGGDGPVATARTR
jgi:hypothetical protein